MSLHLVRLDARRLADFERLLGGKEFGGCFCAVWTSYGPDWEARCKERAKENLAATSDHVRSGGHAGFLVENVDDGAFVGWVAAGPKTAFPFLKERPGSRLGSQDEAVWSVACLAVGFAHRGRGYSREMVRLAVEAARKAGARSIEAYPLVPQPEGAEYRGSKQLFEALGFAVADGEPHGDGHAMRMELKLS